MTYGLLKINNINNTNSKTKTTGRLLSRRAANRDAPLYTIGELVEHSPSGNRGVVFAVDPAFMRSDEWYERQVQPRPDRDQTWYHLLVDNGVLSSYLPEEELQAAHSKNQITHPAIGDYFKSFDGRQYATFQKVNRSAS